MFNSNAKKLLEKKCRGRPCTFDRNELLMRVMHLFWERGYNDLSFNEIAKETGLTRASLYNAFESKENLLIEAINLYFTQPPNSILGNIQRGEAVGPAFYQLFDEVSKARASGEKHRGCLIINCLNELISKECNLSQTLSEMYEQRRSLIEKLIQQAIEQNELPPETDPKTTANILFAFITGFSIFSKNGMDEKTLNEMCHKFLRQVGFKDPCLQSVAKKK